MAKRTIGTIKAESLMTSDVVCLQPTMTVKEAMLLLLKKGVSGAPVTDSQGRVLTVVSEFDLMRFGAKGEMNAFLRDKLKELCASDKLIAVRRQDSFLDVFRHFLTHRVRRVLVLDNEMRLQGLIARGDVIRCFMKHEGGDYSELLGDKP